MAVRSPGLNELQRLSCAVRQIPAASSEVVEAVQRMLKPETALQPTTTPPCAQPRAYLNAFPVPRDCANERTRCGSVRSAALERFAAVLNSERRGCMRLGQHLTLCRVPAQRLGGLVRRPLPLNPRLLPSCRDVADGACALLRFP